MNISGDLILKKNNVVDANGNAIAPVPTALGYGELAVNYSSKEPCLFFKDDKGEIVKIVSEEAITRALTDILGNSAADLDTLKELLAAFEGSSNDILPLIASKADKTALSAHTNSRSNPHQTNKGHLGLGSVDNTSDANKPVSTAQQTALNKKFDKTGGVISGDVIIDKRGNKILRFSEGGVSKAAFGTQAGKTLVANSVSGKLLELLDNGALMYENKKVFTENTLTPTNILDKLKTVDGAGSGLDADTLDGRDSSGYTHSYKNQSISGNLTTSQFLDRLVALGLFKMVASSTKLVWSYADNGTITDSGFGVIPLAGAVIEVFGDVSAMMIRVSTATTSTISNVLTRRVFTYINNSAGYSPKWRMEYGSDNCNLSTVDWNARNLVASGEVTSYSLNGVRQEPTSAGGTTILSDLADVDLTGAKVGDVLQLEGSVWKSKPKPTFATLEGVPNTFEPTAHNHVGSTYNVSDERLKQNIEPLTNGLELILSMNPVNYGWKDEAIQLFNLDKAYSCGLIAQELERLLPSVVGQIDEQYKGVNYVELVPYLIGAVKQLHENIADQNIKFNNMRNAENKRYQKEVQNNEIITGLQSENKALRERLNRLESLIITR